MVCATLKLRSGSGTAPTAHSASDGNEAMVCAALKLRSGSGAAPTAHSADDGNGAMVCATLKLRSGSGTAPTAHSASDGNEAMVCAALKLRSGSGAAPTAHSADDGNGAMVCATPSPAAVSTATHAMSKSATRHIRSVEPISTPWNSHLAIHANHCSPSIASVGHDPLTLLAIVLPAADWKESMKLWLLLPAMFSV
jgi:hypothetical protein